MYINKMFKKLLDFMGINRNKNPILWINLRNSFSLLSFFNIGYKEKLSEIHSLIYVVIDRMSKAIHNYY